MFSKEFSAANYLSRCYIASAINDISFQPNVCPVFGRKMLSEPRVDLLIENEVDPARFGSSGLAAIRPKALVRRVLCSGSRHQPVAGNRLLEAKLVVHFSRGASLHFFIRKAENEFNLGSFLIIIFAMTYWYIVVVIFFPAASINLFFATLNIASFSRLLPFTGTF